MVSYTLKATVNTTHVGGFDRELEPALIIASGDRIEVETYTGYYLYNQAPEGFLTPEFIELCRRLSPERIVGPGPHLLTGPIYIQNAEPGDILEVQLQSIYPRLNVGFNAIRTGWGALPQRFSQPKLRFINLDLTRNIAEFPPQSGVKIPLRPFFGILGVASETPQSSIPPGVHGGNIDNPELQAGSRIFLPVLVPGGLFSIGDGHAAQGGGEVNTTAIETSMNGTIKIILHKNCPLDVPLAETANDIITMGFGHTLDDAFQSTLERTINLLVQILGISPEEAYILCSLAVDFRITQVVNTPQKGVHGAIAKSILPETLSFPPN